MRAPADAPDRLAQNRKRYVQLVRVVKAHAGRGDLERVLRSAVIAGNLGWRAPTGFLNDPELERLVIDTARAGGDAAHVDGGRTSGRVLHVLSEGYGIGGHTRLAWRWMERDSRRSDVALTNQVGPLPAPLAQAAAQSGGQVFDLRAGSAALTGRVEALRRLMDQADVVVMHVHSWDAVALAAAALPGPRPPIVYENHADHAFWLGLGCADVVMDHRAAASQLSGELRGVRRDRLGLLPLPIDDPNYPGDRNALRAALKLQPRDVAAVSVASAFKMAPLWGRGFDDLLLPALKAHPRLKIFLVGAPPEGQWAKLAARFQGRLHALGPRSDLESIFPAMDLYLDSYPVSSGTSILEAAAAGLPLVSLQEHEGHRRIYHANSPGLDPTGHATATDAEYLQRLGELVSDGDLRAERGAAAKAAILQTHSGESWTAALEALYERARSVPAADLGEYPARSEDRSYGAYLVGYMQGTATVREAAEYAEPLGPLFDEPLRCDLFASSGRELGRSLAVRVSRGWENHPVWTVRLLGLAKRYRRLAISLPLVASDDARASGTVARLTDLLSELGQTTDTCGDISLDPMEPTLKSPSIREPLELLPEVLDWLEALLSSPVWGDAQPSAELAAAGAR